MKVFNEIGIGLDWYICQEIEYDGYERRFKGWYKGCIKRIYFRYWVGSNCLVVSMNGIELIRKRKNRFKVVIGFEMM